jgi:Rieske 2Fe-2S family protein
MKAPHADVADPDAFALHPVGVETWQGFVFVNLTPAEARPLAEQVAHAGTALANYGIGDLVTGQVLHYDVAANYKVLLENYNECYHCGPVHPELSRLVPAFAGGGTGLDWDGGIPHREGAWTFTMSGTTDRAPLPGLDEHERTRHKGDLVYPNLMLSASADHVAAFVLHPRAVDRTEVVCSLLFAREAVADDGFDPGDAAELWHLVNQQDWAICESVQRGMSSRAYTHGWFAPMEDDSLDIRRWLLPLLEGR